MLKSKLPHKDQTVKSTAHEEIFFFSFFFDIDERLSILLYSSQFFFMLFLWLKNYLYALINIWSLINIFTHKEIILLV